MTLSTKTINIDEAIMGSSDAHQNQIFQLLGDPKKAKTFAKLIFDMLKMAGCLAERLSVVCGWGRGDQHSVSSPKREKTIGYYSCWQIAEEQLAKLILVTSTPP